MTETWIRVYSKMLEGTILKKIGPALGLLLYLYDKATYQQDGFCIILGGKPITNEEIATDLKINVRTVARNTKLLTELGFIFTINTYGNIRIWCVVGYYKYNNNSPHNKRLDSLVHRARTGIHNGIKNGTIKPINPFFCGDDKSVLTDNLSATKTSTTNDKSDINKDKFDSNNDKYGLSNKDKTKDKTLDKTEIRLNKDNVSINQSSTASTLEATTKADVLEVFRYYMKTIGSGRNTPDDEVYKLIESLIAEEDVSTLKNCINNYEKKVDENDKWRFYPPIKFFTGDFYTGFLDPEDSIHYESRHSPKDPGKF